MILEIQIQSLIVSFVYGMFAALIYNLIYFLLYNKNTFIKVTSNLVFSIFLSILYFYLLYLINNAALHIYFILMLITGFIISNKNIKKIRIIHLKKERN